VLLRLRCTRSCVHVRLRCCCYVTLRAFPVVVVVVDFVTLFTFTLFRCSFVVLVVDVALLLRSVRYVRCCYVALPVLRFCCVVALRLLIYVFTDLFVTVPALLRCCVTLLLLLPFVVTLFYPFALTLLLLFTGCSTLRCYALRLLRFVVVVRCSTLLRCVVVVTLCCCC